MRAHGRRAYAASALSCRPILITGGAPRDFSRKKLSGLALLTPFLKPVSRVSRVKRMRVLPARECVQKTVRTPSFVRRAVVTRRIRLRKTMWNYYIENWDKWKLSQ